jgi:ribonuclease VapC
MVVDSSALVAVLLGERQAVALTEALSEAARVRVSAGTHLESSIVMARRHGEAGVGEMDRLLERFGISIEPVTVEQSYAARAAYMRYGKGRHQAALNFGDCFSYALAQLHDEPLLFVGEDFAHTDIRVAAG